MTVDPAYICCSSVLALALLPWKGKPRKYKVWIVDDRQENLARFKTDHGGEFEITLFSRPQEVLNALQDSSRPDALLCDIYFYEDAQKREELEALVQKDLEALKKSAAKFNPENAQEGIELIKQVRDRFGNSPKFPIYAYTSKGPYLLQGRGFDELEGLDVRWLLKNRGGSALIERGAINRDIVEFEERYSWPRRAWRTVLMVGGLSALGGAILSVIFDRMAKHFGW